MAIMVKINPMDSSVTIALKERMRNFSARDAKNQFGLLIDTARVDPVVIEKHGRPVVVVCSVEEFERLKSLEAESPDPDAGVSK